MQDVHRVFPPEQLTQGVVLFFDKNVTIIFRNKKNTKIHKSLM
jgi:hypothetical protein